MSYLGQWPIGANLTFTVNTHNVTTGEAVDADAVPTYRVYEDETTTPILTGSMALLDSANTVGFYSEQITLSAANGFETGKCYTIYITATVNAVTGTTSLAFQLQTNTIFPAGAIQFTYTVTNSLTAVPIEGVEVWFSTNAGFTNIVWKGDTDAFGVARDVNGNLPMLDAGTYSIRLQKSGFVFTDDSEVVS